jgi:hypothetical protein
MCPQIKLQLDRDPEWALLEAVVLDGVACPFPSIESIVSVHDINWGKVIEYSLLHTLLPMVAKAMVKRFHIPGANPRYDCMPTFIGVQFDYTWLSNRHKIMVVREAMRPVISALEQAEILYTFRNGFVFEDSLYGGDGAREFDLKVELMVNPDSLEEVEKMLKSMGLTHGAAYLAESENTPHSRQENVAIPLQRGPLCSFVVETGNSLFPFVDLDVATSFKWSSSESGIDFEPVLHCRERIRLRGLDGSEIEAYGLDPINDFIFAALHLFCDAWFAQKDAKPQQNVNLMRFADVLRLAQVHRRVYENGVLRARLEQAGALRPIAWTMTHLDRTFGTDICEWMSLTGVADEAYLSSAYDPIRGKCSWRGTMRDRLWKTAQDEPIVYTDPDREVAPLIG